jgi:hypothetical protein
MDGNVMAGKTLTIVLAADISRLSRGLKSAQNDLDYFNGKLGSTGSKLSGMLVPGLLGAAAAAGTLAVAMGVEGVKSALAEEAAQAKLAKTLENLGLESATEQTTAFIESQMRATGVADDLLRPAYDRLIRATRDIGAANRAMTLAMDISAGTGKSLEAVSNSLGRAYEGSTASLGKLGTGLDKATLATGDMEAITAQLAATFGGQAATQADTFAGKIEQLKTAGGELTEAFGKGVLDAFTKTTKDTGNLSESLYEMQGVAEDLGKNIGFLAGNILLLIGYASNLQKGFASLANQGGLTGGVFTALGDVIYKLSNPVGWLADVWGRLTGAQEENEAVSYGLLNTVGMTVTNYRAQAKAVEDVITPTVKHTGTVKINTEALDAQNKVLEVSKSKLSAQSDALKQAGQAYVDYWQNLQGQISSGIDLAAAFDLSQTTGQSLTETLGAQIADMDWYGTILTGLQGSGASQALMDAITEAGPTVGAKLGEKILLEGLIPSLNAQLEYVKTSSTLTAQAMVPAFLLEGQNAAIGFVEEAAKQVLKDQDKLKKIGKNIGKPVALQAANEIAETLAKAWQDIEAAKTAAAAAASAAASGRRVVVSDQQAIQQLNQILANGNARAGYQDTVVIA